jgi:hypothetical protein
MYETRAVVPKPTQIAIGEAYESTWNQIQAMVSRTKRFLSQKDQPLKLQKPITPQP